MSRHLESLAILLFLPFTSCGTPWTVLKAADPNPFVDQKEFKLLPLEYVDLRVDGKTEAEHVAALKADGTSWAADKAAIQANFRSAIAARAASKSLSLGDAGAYVLKPTVKTIETGYYRIPAWNAVSRIQLHLQIVDSGGQVLDEIRIEPSIPWDIFNPATGGRLRSAAVRMGTWAADYLVKRVRSK